MFRFLSSLLVALALFVSPLSMLGGGGMAMAHAPTVAEMGGHCEDMPGGEEQDVKKALDCTSICSAMAAAPSPLIQGSALAGAAAEPERQDMLASIAPESEKPPPRIS